MMADRERDRCVICGQSHPEISGCNERVGGKYVVKRELGRGGMGCVFEALNVTEIVPGHPLNDRVALKVLLPEFASDGVIVGRFVKEAQAAATLGGENIVKVHDGGQTRAGGCYLVMEYLEGSDCQSLLAKEPRGLAVADAVEIVVQACRGLRHAHEDGLVHRDLKPANLFVTSRRDGTRLVKILDFGIAKHRSAGAEQSKTSADYLLGTVAYMSREQLRDAGKVDARSDIYALGVILYELLSGRRPFEADNQRELMAKILSEEATPLAALQPILPQGLCKLVHRALAGDPGRRPASVQELEVELRRFAASPTVPMAPHRAAAPNDVTRASEATLAHAPTALAPRAEPTTNAPVVPPGEERAARDVPRSGRVLVWVMGAALVSLVGSGIWLAVSPSPAEELSPSAAEASPAPSVPASAPEPTQPPPVTPFPIAAESQSSPKALGTVRDPPSSSKRSATVKAVASNPSRAGAATASTPLSPSQKAPAVASTPISAPTRKRGGAFDDRK
jgi:serine/threonine-protein kinase